MKFSDPTWEAVSIESMKWQVPFGPWPQKIAVDNEGNGWVVTIAGDVFSHNG